MTRLSKPVNSKTVF